ncbi:KUP system potassium uptake protein [Rhodoligotrophos appendicifer]|uniref:potassium transporter Kup n=1 Tax=Rhodoligotrophos appendicifer TaxID=987056 RepID=UPI001185AF2E|nr:potassium transporter Kup [Rhodoligotrophos appendicifer]
MQTSSAKSRVPALTIAAIGVVFGDIGTSPLYAMRVAFSDIGGLPFNEAAVLGVLSLLFWSLIILVTITYVTVLLRADNRGEGGVLALSSLLFRTRNNGRLKKIAIVLSLVGAALFYGDGIITPAISVLSAVEGVHVIAPALSEFVVPIAIVILVALFMVQRTGTARVGRLFGPIMCIWFAVLAALGLFQIVQSPSIIRALSPHYAIELFIAYPIPAFLSLGAIVLAVTGAEALYADMGHFGRKPIRLAWYCGVAPALVLNYLGQGALILRTPSALEHPFYHLAPTWAQPGLVVIATLATVIASQALISGVFSLTRQAVQLDYLPRLEIRHTSEHEQGQVYLPAVNWLMMAAVTLVVIGFGSSDDLASAYGIAVVSAMLVDATLLLLVTIYIWQWHPVLISAFFAVLFFVDLMFLASNSLKIIAGGWFPIVIAAFAFSVMWTWRMGRQALTQRIERDSLHLIDFVRGLATSRVVRVPGTAVFLSRRTGIVPASMLHNMKHNKVLHERVIVLTVVTEAVPIVPDDERLAHEDLGAGVHKIVLYTGFIQSPNVPRALAHCSGIGKALSMMDTSFFVSRETLVRSSRPDLPPWQEQMFITLAGLASDATQYYHIPRNRVVELGRQIEI